MNWSKLVVKNLMQDQKDMRRDRCIDFLESIENDPHFLECVIIGDEIWKPSTRACNGTLQALQGKKIKNEQIKDQKHADVLFV